jgi:GT2 family glycosyltransferase/protein-L-isoaspartate O-methyltransferase
MPKPLTTPNSRTALGNTGERFLPSITRSITGLEHYHRYLFASSYCEGCEVLDLACGEGYGAALLAQVAARVVGIDIDRATVAAARQKYGAAVTFVCADGASIPLADASVDVVVSFETIEHVPDPERLLHELRRVLRQDGVLVISSPNKSVYGALHPPNQFHVRELEQDEFARMLEQRFRHVWMGQQQALHASVIDSPSPDATYFELTLGKYQRSERLSHLAYSVAVASNGDRPLDLPKSYLLDTQFDGTAHRYHEHSAIYEARDPSVVAALEELRQLKADSRRREETMRAREAAVLAELAAAQAQAEQQIAEREAQLAAATSRLAAQEANLAAQEQRTQAHERENAALQEALEKISRSWSWRATAWLRALLDGVRGGRRRAAAASKHKTILLARTLAPATARAAFTLRRSGLFDAAHYRARYFDVAGYGDTLCLLHYCVHGWREGREPRAGFDPRQYLKTHPDVARAGVDPLLHFARFGRGEGRWHLPDVVPDGDQPLPPQPPLPTPGVRTGTAGTAWTHGSARAIDLQRDPWAHYEEFRAHVFAARAASRRRTSARKPVLAKATEVAAAAREIDATLACSATPAVSIAIPVHDALQVTLECLLAIAQHTDQGTYEVVVVDDASSSSTAACLAGLRPIRYFRQEQQAGFGATCNHAVARCRAPLVVLLNSDTQVQPGWLAALTAPLAEPSVGMVGPMLLFPNGVLQEAGGRLRADGSGEMVGLGEDAGAPRFQVRRNVDYVSGACAAFRKADFERLGGFDARFAPAYAEDADLCLQMQHAGLRVVYEPAARVVHHLSQTTQSQGQLAKVALATKQQEVLLAKWGQTLAQRDQVRVITFYLPQFHPVAENDRWWGEGFTEWRNVVAARARFEGHYQPRQPADLGYYDLRTPGVMQRQAELARRYGVHGFALYYYRFGDRRVLDQPVEAINADLAWTFPFCLVWANENWTRRWDGQEKDILLEQTYSAAELDAIAHDFLRSFRHPAYIRVDGAPLLLIYNPLALPDAPAILLGWREFFAAHGEPRVYFVAVESFALMRMAWDPQTHGFDATVEFPPHECGQPIYDRRGVDPAFTGVVHDYRRMVEALATRALPPYTRFRCVAPGWDNTARRRNDSNVFVHVGPAEYQVWLEAAIADTKSFRVGDERMVFVNAWNEWAEGAYLEPDLKYGHAFLLATRQALEAEGWRP